MARSKGKKGREGNGKRGGEGMTKRLSLPVLNCDGCGACCQEQAALPVSWYLVIVPLLGRPTGLPPALLSELESMRDRFFADGFPPDGSPCIWYDPETK